MIASSREARRLLVRENHKQSSTLVEIPRGDWPTQAIPPGLVRVLRSRDFLVQVYEAPGPAVLRLSVNRTQHDGARWADRITWDDLQALKRQAGYGDVDAIEMYPRDRDVVNVANVRHLWVMAPSADLSFAWRA